MLELKLNQFYETFWPLFINCLYYNTILTPDYHPGRQHEIGKNSLFPAQ